jgi:NADH-quinone oxidoreductase subunit N
VPVGDVLPEIVVLVTAVITLLCASWLPRPRQTFCAALALAGTIAAAALVHERLGAASRLTFSQVFALDDPAQIAALLILGATAVATLLAPAWLRTDRRHGEYYTAPTRDRSRPA